MRKWFGRRRYMVVLSKRRGTGAGAVRSSTGVQRAGVYVVKKAQAYRICG